MHYYITEHGVKVCKVCDDDWHGEGRPVTEATDCYTELRRKLLRQLQYIRRGQATRDTFGTWRIWSDMNWLLHRRDVAHIWLMEASAEAQVDDYTRAALEYAIAAVMEARVAVSNARVAAEIGGRMRARAAASDSRASSVHPRPVDRGSAAAAGVGDDTLR